MVAANCDLMAAMPAALGGPVTCVGVNKKVGVRGSGRGRGGVGQAGHLRGGGKGEGGASCGVGWQLVGAEGERRHQPPAG